MCISFLSHPSSHRQRWEATNPGGLPPGLLHLWAGPRSGLGLKAPRGSGMCQPGVSGLAKSPEWGWLPCAGRKRERHTLLLSGAVVSGVGERVALQCQGLLSGEGSLGEGTSIRPGRQILPLGGGRAGLPLAQISAGQLRVSFGRGGGRSITKVLTAQRQQLPLRQKQEDILKPVATSAVQG